MQRSMLFTVCLMAAAIGTAGQALAPAGATQCGSTTTSCAAGHACCAAQYSPTKYGCSFGSTCCLPGPPNPPSTTLPNCLVIGDSVSIGYTPFVTRNLTSACAVQHGPWDVSDGGASSTGYGIECLDNWLVTQAQQAVKWDVIQFNFGLHDLDNSSTAEALYKGQLENITKRLVATGAKLQYALTTPFMPDKTVGDSVVQQLNTIAQAVIAPYKIPVVDLYTLVTDHCGAVYKTCDICRVTPCSYHYNAQGEAMQGAAVADAFRQRLAGQ